MSNTSKFERTFSIFGEPISIQADAPTLSRLIEREFSCYPSSEDHAKLQVYIGDKIPKDHAYSQNPKSHIELERGFSIQSKMLNSRWASSEAGDCIHAKINEYPFPLPIAYRYLHRQYTSRSEMLGQILHESVFVPRMLTQPKRALLHASAIIPPSSNSPICIGGTGGSGKTSLMLMACMEKRWGFAADDFCALSTQGSFYPNFSYPKIYGYNVNAFPSIKEHLFQESSSLDKLHWKLHHLRGMDKVRRRMDPRKLFKTTDAGELSAPSDYVILFRDNVKDYILEEIPVHLAALTSSLVLKTEYSAFINHLNWSMFNQQLRGSNQQNTDTLFDHSDAWITRTESALQSTRCWTLRFPKNANHREFLKEAWPIIEGLPKA